MTSVGERARNFRSEEGSSLIEMVVVIALTTVIVAAVGTMMVVGQRTSGGTAIRIEQGDQAQVGMSAMSKALRTAGVPQSCPTCGSEALTRATATGVTFFEAVGDKPTRVTFDIVTASGSTSLVQTTQPADAGTGTSTVPYKFSCTGASCGIQTRTLARNVVPGSSFFTYNDGTSTVLTPPVTTGRGKITSVDVALAIKKPNVYGTPQTTLNMRVGLPNASSLVANPTATP